LPHLAVVAAEQKRDLEVMGVAVVVVVLAAWPVTVVAWNVYVLVAGELLELLFPLTDPT
jgi:phosphopantothenate synthetase